MFKKLFPVVLVAVMAVPALAAAQNKYVGADKCKSCHNTAAMGKQIDVWKASPHGKAFDVLKGDAAQKIAKGAEKDAKCLKCHDLAAFAPAAEQAASLKKEAGVGCEACHGAGDKHVKARMADESETPKIAADEIVAKPAEAVCTKCHNKESPTFKAFNYAEAVKKIAHPKGKK